MSASVAAARFVLASATGRAPGVRVQARALALPGEVLDADVYEGPGEGVRGTVLFVHGMTLHGHRDPRQVQACRALASTGLRVVAPRLPSIAQARIDPDAPALLGRAIAAIAADHRLAPAGRIGLFSASFSASMALLAAADPATARHLGAICALGPYADLHGCLAFVMQTDGVDRYARTILFQNLLRRALGPCPAVEQALSVAVADDSFRRDPPALPRALAALTPEDRRTVERVLGDPAWCRGMADQVLAASQDLVHALDLLPRVRAIRVPVALLHGRNDDVIPADQSRLLHRELRAGGGESRLLVTPLLSHGDAQWGIAGAREGLRLWRLFAWFLARVPRP